MSDTGAGLTLDDAMLSAAAGGGSVGDYFALMKPRVMSLVVFTAFVGMALAPGMVHPVIALTALIAIAVGAGASGALNMWYDADIDGKMTRTASRPIPAGRMLRGDALGFGATLAVGSVLVLGALVNWTASALLALTIGFYLFVYTMWLKRLTPHNIVIGGAAGALPPVVGWAAAGGPLGLEPLILFAIIFLWTPSHFWALALFRAGDYARAGVPMLPVVAGTDETRRQILIYAIALAAVSLLPGVIGFAGPLFTLLAAGLGVVYVVAAWRVYSRRDGNAAMRAARRLFGISILYLFLLFGGLLADHFLVPDLTIPWSALWGR